MECNDITSACRCISGTWVLSSHPLVFAVVVSFVAAGRWHLSLAALKQLLSHRASLLPVGPGVEDGGISRASLLHLLHVSVSHTLQLLARHTADCSLTVSRSIQGLLVGFEKACSSWCASCGVSTAELPSPSESLTLEALLEQETAFAALERQINKLMLHLPEGLGAKQPAADAESKVGGATNANAQED